MKKYKCLIYDDDKVESEKLCTLIQNEFQEQDVDLYIAETREQAEKIIKNDINALFVDIELENQINGIDFACYVKENHPEIKIIFITAHIKYCEEIFAANPCGFLVKPFTVSRVKRSLEILKKFMYHEDYLILNIPKSSTKRILLNEIVYIEGNNRKLIFYNVNHEKVYEVNGKLSLIEENLPDYFMKCHHSFCVNLKFVNNIHRYEVILKCGGTIPVSQQKYTTSKEKFFKYLGDTI